MFLKTKGKDFEGGGVNLQIIMKYCSTSLYFKRPVININKSFFLPEIHWV